jgi:hypothetical protein
MLVADQLKVLTKGGAIRLDSAKLELRSREGD